ncbi:hypothetical protein O181_075847 [Austropuccinia psidii MF-1]|uniref:Retrovirus-related Pol polyprotein from transposon TNT 1-94-like beta-barrel domain-containing protein n=1 Tax=Austropuccinia psidii MF-1 TaxID=1389203 RepID=A0A9Q3FFS1_9BASI|nr:hypothetical protein [Austropuccinia psidii MF-1]
MRAKLVEVGAEDPGIEVLQAGVDNVENLSCELVCDTGASHSLTGDLSSLFPFCHLNSAIPVSVATKQSGHRSHVTGVGSLLYPGLDGRLVVIHGVYYCPDATCTLISPAALIHAGFTFRFDLNNDMLLCGSDRQPLLRVMFCKKLHWWSMPPFYKPTPDEMYFPMGDLKTNLPSQI